MIKFNTCCPLIGSEVVLLPECVLDWDDVINSLPDSGTCNFSVHHNDIDYTGIVAPSSDRLTLLVAFDQSDVMLPSGVCFDVDCPSQDPTPENPEYCNNTLGELDDQTRLAILDDEGCPAGYVLFGDLKQNILDAVKDDLNFCDFFPNGIPQGNLVVSDRVLTTSGQCSLKSVPQSDIACD